MGRRLGREAASAALLAALYFATARVGLLLDPVGGVATPVWPPTGIALSALLLLGRQAWPGITLGAVLANATTGVPPLAVALIAVGNTLEALAGEALLRRAGFQPALARLRDVLALLALGAGLSTLVSAGGGVLALWLSGVPVELGRAFGVWWLGDFMGDLLVAPLLLSWSGLRLRALRPARLLEGALALAGTVVVLLVVVLRPRGPGAVPIPQTYMVFPPLVWMAVRYGQRGAASGSFAVAAAATWATARGLGPFVHGSRAESLLLLQTFLLVVAGTVLVLGAAVAERRAAVELRDNFLSVASHELKTPLTALKLRVQMLQRFLRQGNQAGAERAEAMLLASDAQLNRLAAMIDELLDVSRLRGGRIQLAPEPVDLAELVRGVVERLAEGLSGARCTVEVRAAGPVVGHWDRLRLEQVVTNLLTNAARYGAGTPILVSLTQQGEQARLAVEDGGPGVAREDRLRIFEPFERGPRRDGNGLGLGLHIVRQIVEAHRGAVRVEEAQPRGAAFVVELPLQPALSPASPGSPGGRPGR